MSTFTTFAESQGFTRGCMRTRLTRGSFSTPSANTYLLMPDPTDDYKLSYARL